MATTAGSSTAMTAAVESAATSMKATATATVEAVSAAKASATESTVISAVESAAITAKSTSTAAIAATTCKAAPPSITVSGSVPISSMPVIATPIVPASVVASAVAPSIISSPVIAVIPGPDTNEHAIYEVIRPPIAVRRTVVRVVIEVTVIANRRRPIIRAVYRTYSDSNGNLRFRISCGKKQNPKQRNKL